MLNLAERRYLTPSKVLGMKDPSWLLEGLIPTESMTILYGAPKLGKSFIALDMAICISSGIPWYDHATEDPRPVIYLAGEGLGGLGRRLRAWEVHYGRKIEDGQLFFPNRIVNTHSAGEMAMFLDEIKKHEVLDGRVELIVVDTLSRSLVGADENSAGDVSLALHHLDYLRQETGAAVLILHHTTKGNPATERGSTALRGAADVMLHLSRKDGQITFQVNAARDFESGFKRELKFVKIEDSGVIVPTAPVVPRKEICIKLLAKLPPKTTLKLWRLACIDAGVPQSSAYLACNQLIEEGLVIRGTGDVVSLPVALALDKTGAAS